jgi:hypothetical protein
MSVYVCAWTTPVQSRRVYVHFSREAGIGPGKMRSFLFIYLFAAPTQSMVLSKSRSPYHDSDAHFVVDSHFGCRCLHFNLKGTRLSYAIGQYCDNHATHNGSRIGCFVWAPLPA